ncbi:putative uncharacterized protein DDB_G0282133 [Microplitis mediator]|uniref:putative uncharacterized protein DDB_G0282133 n=1 Tax=Microplitis mediator TaxID=375433 RepID=UPI002554623B|nr:putative uncharacterized protein DDB_G0282133 [Microplitis mediator]
MAAYESSRCYACKKLFCCIDCCSNHIRKKHSAHQTPIDCPLCRQEPLIIRSFDHNQLKNHIIFNHLPLECLKCGELFDKHEDLKFIGTCDRHPIIRIEAPTYIEVGVTSSSSSSFAVDLDLAGSVLSKTPSADSSIKRKSLSFSGDYRQFEDSPREFTRHTSTPMQVGLTRQLNSSNLNYKGGNFFFKTSSRHVGSVLTVHHCDKSVNNNSDSNNNNNNSVSNYNFNDINPGEFNSQDNLITKSYLSNSDRTPLKSILSKSFNKDTSYQGISNSNLLRSITERKLEAMMESNDENDDGQGSNPGNSGGSLKREADSLESTGEYKSSRKNSKILSKRVRFSDEFSSIEADTDEDNLNNEAEVEEYFESCQSFSDTSISSTEKNIHCNHTGDDKLNVNKKINGKSELNQGNEKAEDNFNQSRTGSSRVVMMVLVEKAGEVYPRDLAPIIDSGLERLKSAINASSATELELAADNHSDIKDCQSGFTMLSVDSYTKLSTLECVKVADSSSSGSSLQINRSVAKQNINSGGIFASVANAVRNVFKNISGSSRTTKTIGQSSSLGNELQDDLSIDSCESAITSLSRAAKRPREEIEFITSTSSSSSSSPSYESLVDDKSERKTTGNDIRSPVLKKPRGWYKQVRGREPIARMKNDLSSPPLPRGVSMETQCFHQGSLSTKDAVLPLPDRAQVNRSTQTDF